MMQFPIRIRLTVWYFVFLAASLTSFALLAVVLVRQSIYGSVDERLQDRARAVQDLIRRAADEDLPDELREHAELQPGSELLQVSDDAGHFIYRSRRMEWLGIQAVQPHSSEFTTVAYGNRPLRMLATATSAAGQQFVIQVGEPMGDFHEAISRFRAAVLIVIPVLLLVATAGGYLMSTRALAPVDQITHAAQNITAHDLSTRVEVPRTGDEIQRLAQTINAMLQRIESAFSRITQFTADASHELRTPVALIRTQAELALRKSRSEGEYRESLREVLAESERTSSLIENLMLLARADAGTETLRFEKLDLAELAREVVGRGRALAKAKNLGWSTEISIEALWVEGDALALQRLFLILIDNAVKYTPPNGQIRVGVARDDGRALIEVQDSGIGISDKDLPHIFERFYRTDKARSRESGGAGLGLSIGRWITNAHDAEIGVDSATGGGSTFRVRIPLTNLQG
jgi:heavy metal sensor kinase